MADKLPSPQLVASDGARLWDRRADEPEVAYRIFTLYRDIGPDRSFDRIAEVFADPSLIKQWSGLYTWQSRCMAYDQWVESERQTDLEETVTARSKRHRSLARAAQTLAGVELRWYLEQAKARKDLDPKKQKALLTGSQLAKIIKDSVILERLIAGEATERTDDLDGGIDYDRLPVEDLAQLHHLLSKAKK